METVTWASITEPARRPEPLLQILCVFLTRLLPPATWGGRRSHHPRTDQET